MKKYITTSTGTAATLTIPVGIAPDQVIVTNAATLAKLVYNRLDTENPNGIAIAPSVVVAASGDAENLTVTAATKAASAAAGLSVSDGAKSGTITSTSVNDGRGTKYTQATGVADSIVIGASAAVNVDGDLLIIEVIEADLA